MTFAAGWGQTVNPHDAVEAVLGVGCPRAAGEALHDAAGARGSSSQTAGLLQVYRMSTPCSDASSCVSATAVTATPILLLLPSVNAAESDCTQPEFHTTSCEYISSGGLVMQIT